MKMINLMWLICFEFTWSMLLSKNDINYVKLICDSEISQFNQLKNENGIGIPSADGRSKSKILKTTIPGQSSPVLKDSSIQS